MATLVTGQAPGTRILADPGNTTGLVALSKMVPQVHRLLAGRVAPEELVSTVGLVLELLAGKKGCREPGKVNYRSTAPVEVADCKVTGNKTSRVGKVKEPVEREDKQMLRNGIVVVGNLVAVTGNLVGVVYKLEEDYRVMVGS